MGTIKSQNDRPIATSSDLQHFLQTKKVKEAALKANAEKVAANSKEKLIKSLRKKFQTTMIGALVRVEDNFGSLWGHGKLEADLTDDEAANREVWNLVRNEILNNGNTQLRHAVDELSRYRVTYEGFKMSLPVKPMESNDE